MVNRAEAEMETKTEENNQAYKTYRWVVIGFAIGSTGLAILLGYAVRYPWSTGLVDGRAAQADRPGIFRSRSMSELGRTRTLAKNLNKMNGSCDLYQSVGCQPQQVRASRMRATNCARR
jgi:hypothetical protein